MKSIVKMLFVLVLSTMAGCKRHPPSQPSGIANSDLSAMNSADNDGGFVREASTDHGSPPYIRQSAAVFVRLLDGVEANEKTFSQAIGELAATRNEKTCRIWISMMHASEAGLPKVLPPLAEFAKLEKQKFDGIANGIESNPLRFTDVLLPCVKYLTVFDMPEADREVAGFMRRFESKYGDSDAGKLFLKTYQMEITHALADRKTGTPHWKLGRK